MTIQQELDIYWFEPVQVLVVAAHPLRKGVQTVLFLIEAGDDVWVNPGMLEVDPADFRFVCSSDKLTDDRFRGAFKIAEQAHKPVLRSPEDAWRRLRYVADEGTELVRVKQYDVESWVILTRWPLWRRKRLFSWRDRLDDFHAHSDFRGTIDWLQKRCSRLGLVPSS
jgi:hypothetical protein